MKKLCLVLFIILSLCSFAKSKDRSIQSSVVISNTTDFKNFPNIFRPVGNLFRRIFRKPRPIICYSTDVKDVKLSSQEITAFYAVEGADRVNTALIEVSTIAVSGPYEYTEESHPSLTFKYTVTAGKISGEGIHVVWNLTDVKAGEYTITAAVDDGCGFCSKTVTKTITVKECTDCKSDKVP